MNFHSNKSVHDDNYDLRRDRPPLSLDSRSGARAREDSDNVEPVKRELEQPVLSAINSGDIRFISNCCAPRLCVRPRIQQRFRSRLPLSGCLPADLTEFRRFIERHVFIDTRCTLLIWYWFGEKSVPVFFIPFFLYIYLDSVF